MLAACHNQLLMIMSVLQFVVYGVGAANISEVAFGLGRHSVTLTFEQRAHFFMALCKLLPPGDGNVMY